MGTGLNDHTKTLLPDGHDGFWGRLYKKAHEQVTQLVAEIKALKAENDALRASNQALKEQLDDLKRKFL